MIIDMPMCLFVQLFTNENYIRIFWKQGIADLGAIQFPLSMQAVPGESSIALMFIWSLSF